MEDFLSEELKNELGASDDLVLPSKKKKKRTTGEAVDIPPEEIPLSKKAKKYLESLNVKKEKEKKRTGYLETLQKYQISKDQQDLLLSTRDAGQHHTAKSKLKRAFKLHKAGLDLSEEARDLLFPQSDRSNSVHQPLIVTKAVVTDILSKNEPAATGNGSVGSMLLKQFKNLKKNPSKVLAVSQDQQTKMNIDDNSDNLSDEFYTINPNIPKTQGIVIRTSTQDIEAGMGSRSPYIPKELILPILPDGSIVMNQGISANNKVASLPNASKRKTIMLKRRDDIQVSRLQLPVCGMEQEIVEAISQNDVTILCGETGSGKSTQVPQFLYEAGYTYHGMIGITQPRRVAAISTATRVSDEMGSRMANILVEERHKGKRKKDDLLHGVVGYQVRHDSTAICSNTVIKFMTDGILLKEVSKDFLLRKYSAIILDEAHERSVNTDILIGMLSRLIPLRRKLAQEENEKWMLLPVSEQETYEKPIQPLRLVIMSATLRVTDFQSPNLFTSVPPVISVEARQFPVITHFAKRTEMNNYLHDTFVKVCQIHRKLPAGGILIFLTGKRDILHMCHKLARTLNAKLRANAHKQKNSLVGKDELYHDDNDDAVADDPGDRGLDTAEAEADMWINKSDSLFEAEDEYDDAQGSDISDIEDDGPKKPSKSKTANNEGGKESNDIQSLMLREALGESMPTTSDGTRESVTDDEDSPDSNMPRGVLVLPLYAMLSPQKQRLVFQPTPEDMRLIVVATNVAETSITIPGIRYVVDCGRQKSKIVDQVSGISKYEVTWISKASADQRKGRAGRTGPGHCYRLYSSAFYDQHMIQFQEPEICSSPLEDVLLQLRALGIENEQVFPFPTPPPRQALSRAYCLLTSIGAIRPPFKKISGWESALNSINNCLESNKNSLDIKAKNTGAVTSLGKKIAKFPINVRLAKMLIVAHNTGVIPVQLSTALAACLSERSPFLKGSLGENDNNDLNDNDEENDLSKDEKDEKDSHGSDLWFHPNSDILAVLKAFGAFSYFEAKANQSQSTISSKRSIDALDVSDAESEIVSFCNQFNVHHGTLKRISDLQKQLQSIYNQVLNTNNGPDISTLTSFGALPPPTSSQETALRQIIVTGYCDCIARRIVSGNIMVQGLSRRKRLTGYVSCDASITTPIYLHPNSALYRKDPTASLPEFVSYNQLISNQRGDTVYMTGVTVVNPAWMPDLLRDSPLLHWHFPSQYPLPFYSPESDCVMCHVATTYGAHYWELPSVTHNMQTVCERAEKQSNKSVVSENDTNAPIGYTRMQEPFRWFARLFLEGKILKDSQLLGVFRLEHLVDSPSIITSMKPSKKVVALLGELVREDVQSKHQLIAVLKQNNQYLSEELQSFFKIDHRKLFRQSWKRYLDSLSK